MHYLPHQITKKTTVCSAHFLATDFKFSPAGLNVLKPGTVPSAFQWPKSPIGSAKKKPRKPPRKRLYPEPVSTSTIEPEILSHADVQAGYLL